MAAGRPEPATGVSGREWGALTLAVAGAALTGASSTLMHLAGSPAATEAFFRAAYALPVLAVLAWLERKRAGRASAVASGSRARGKMGGNSGGSWAAAVAGVLLAVDLLLWQRSVMTLGAGLSTVVQDSQVLFVAAAGWFLPGQRISRRVVAAFPLLALGVFTIAVGGPAGSSRGSDPAAGTLFALASALAYAGYIVALPAAGRSRGPARVAAAGGDAGRSTRSGTLLVVSISAAVTSLVAGGLFGGLDLVPRWPSAGWLALLGLAVQVLGWMVLLSAMARIGTLQASLVLLLQPVVALLWGAAVLGEDPAGWQLVGIGVVLISVGVITLPATERVRLPARTV